MDEDELKQSFARNRRLADRFGKLIVVGLSLDIVFLLIFAENKSWKEILAGIFATAVIAVGVWFEIHFGGKAEDDAFNLQRISDQKLAEADARAVLGGRGCVARRQIDRCHGAGAVAVVAVSLQIACRKTTNRARNDSTPAAIGRLMERT